MEDSTMTATTSTDVSDTWSHKATRSSPPPTLQPEQGEAIHSGSPLPTKESPKKNDKNAQGNALRGVGSQFPPIDDQVMNKELDPDL
ncbi:uncharacterized protein TrAtP1_003617 [Trichoderma atroviride]|uniref:uncharacterized protein n=1 Tax=Hypocrea atroviridis TaxID=63577 RepID=UPI003328A774|nr:hypothetical protein TrAtP1_003617 [Trichoderma atroviride]